MYRLEVGVVFRPRHGTLAEVVFTDVSGEQLVYADKPIWSDEAIPMSGESVHVRFPVRVVQPTFIEAVACCRVELDADAIRFRSQGRSYFSNRPYRLPDGHPAFSTLGLAAQVGCGQTAWT